MWGPEKGRTDIEWSWSWWRRLGVSLHQSAETECWQMLRAEWLPGCSAGCWGWVTGLPMWVSSEAVGRLCQGNLSPWEVLWADKTQGQRSSSECCGSVCWHRLKTEWATVVSWPVETRCWLVGALRAVSMIVCCRQRLPSTGMCPNVECWQCLLLGSWWPIGAQKPTNQRAN